MWALGLLILTLLYLAAAGLLARLLPTVAKIVFCLIALEFPSHFPIGTSFIPVLVSLKDFAPAMIGVL